MEPLPVSPTSILYIKKCLFFSWYWSMFLIKEKKNYICYLLPSEINTIKLSKSCVPYFQAAEIQKKRKDMPNYIQVEILQIFLWTLLYCLLTDFYWFLHIFTLVNPDGKGGRGVTDTAIFCIDRKSSSKRPLFLEESIHFYSISIDG